MFRRRSIISAIETPRARSPSRLLPSCAREFVEDLRRISKTPPRPPGSPYPSRSERAFEHRLLDSRARPEHLGRGLVLLMFEQPIDQLAARVVLLNSCLADSGSRGKSIRDLISINVAAMTKKSLATVISILHQAKVAEVFVRDPRDGDVVDADLLLPYEVEQ